MSSPKPQNPKSLIPTDFFTFKTVGTLAGSTGAVWLTCLVISSLLPEKTLTPLLWRYIALATSEFIVIVLFLKTEERGLVNWMIAILNGFLVFVNASGINAMSMASGGRNNSDSSHKTEQSGFFPTSKEVSWWPDRELLEKSKQKITIPASDTIISKKELENMKTVILKYKEADSIAKLKPVTYKKDTTVAVTDPDPVVTVVEPGKSKIIDSSEGVHLAFEVESSNSGHFYFAVKNKGDYDKIKRITYTLNKERIMKIFNNAEDIGNAFSIEREGIKIPKALIMLITYKDNTRRRLVLDLQTQKFLN